jgi:glycosyltransferase involved in cell wall biosynthesis
VSSEAADVDDRGGQLVTTSDRPITWINRDDALVEATIRQLVGPVRTVLDVGAGIRPQKLVPTHVHICVEPYKPYVERLRNEVEEDRDWVFLSARWQDVLPLMPDDSIDTVLALDVIEHVEKEEGLRLLHEAKRVARHQVVVFTPLGFYPQAYEPDGFDRWHMHGGRWQTHRSGWEPQEFGREWQIVACRDLHLTDQDGAALEEPIGAFWAVYGEAPSIAPVRQAESEQAQLASEPATTNSARARRLPKKPRVLFVAMGDSVHAARWIAQLEGLGWELFLLPVDRHAPIHELFAKRAPSVQVVEGWPLKGISPERAVRMTRRFKPGWPVRNWQLARVVRRLKPNIVHSLEIQRAGYMTHWARHKVGEEFPTWIVSNWGSDTYLFGRLDDHRERVRSVLMQCDYYAAECLRDVVAAQQLGLRGTPLPVLPNAGGVDLDYVAQFRTPGPVSARRTIALRGYQHWAGRAFTGIRAIERAADVLGDYTIEVYNWQWSPDVQIAVNLAAKRSGLNFVLAPRMPHDEIWQMYGRSRALVALSIGDGISTSMLEAIAMGSFPIQSHTSCADEWLEHGKTGFLVHPEDPEEVEVAIRRVVADDALVDEAATITGKAIRSRLDTSVVRPAAIAMYEQVMAEQAQARS